MAAITDRLHAVRLDTDPSDQRSEPKKTKGANMQKIYRNVLGKAQNGHLVKTRVDVTNVGCAVEIDIEGFGLLSMSVEEARDFIRAISLASAGAEVFALALTKALSK